MDLGSSGSERGTAAKRESVIIANVELELCRQGKGPPLLLLGSEEMPEPEAPVANALASMFELLMPFPPGFGRSARPDWITCVDDIAYLYLELIQKLGLDDAALIGCSLGGWIAAEMATKDCSRLARLLLVDPYGVKFAGVGDRDIADIWFLAPDKVAELYWRDPLANRRDLAAASDDELAVLARNRESFARFCWEPYLHDPKLPHRMGRIDIPTLLVWGEHDGIVSTSYGRAYCNLIPDAELKIVPDSGHFPHIERPDTFLALVHDFLSPSQR